MCKEASKGIETECVHLSLWHMLLQVPVRAYWQLWKQRDVPLLCQPTDPWAEAQVPMNILFVNGLFATK
jgi:hypothetical protein